MNEALLLSEALDLFTFKIGAGAMEQLWLDYLSDTSRNYHFKSGMGDRTGSCRWETITVI